jgi:hypothetical protein
MSPAPVGHRLGDLWLLTSRSATDAAHGQSHHTEEVGIAMSEPKNAGVKTLGIRLPDELHAQFALVAQLDGLSLTDAIRRAVEFYVASKQGEADFAARAQAALEEIEREAAARRNAITALFGQQGRTANEAEGGKQGRRRSSGTEQS